MSPSYAATNLPGPADIDRAQEKRVPDLNGLSPQNLPQPETQPVSPFATAPDSAKSVRLVLKSVKVEGVTAYDDERISGLYKDIIGKEVTLEAAWNISAQITKLYRDDGYFLSRAFIPAQEIETGNLTIRVVEGFVSDIEIDGGLESNAIVQQIFKTIKSQKPLSVKLLERQHLLLSDLPGLQNYQGTLVPLKDRKDGAVKLVFAKKDSKIAHTSIKIDNYGSQYLGPQQLTLGWSGHIIPLQKTTLTMSNSLPLTELNAINFSHLIPISQVTRLVVEAGFTRAEPGFTLSPQEIQSRALNMSFGIEHQLIRQRQENLSLTAKIDGRNSKSTTLGTELSKDHVRAIRAGGSYDVADGLSGYNIFGFTLSRGLSILEASSENDTNLSRDGIDPNFTKIEMNYTRFQSLPHQLGLTFQLQGQKSSGSLYSSEEFGFGGSRMGRAYSPSEISGDDGFASSIEAQYFGLPSLTNLSSQPFVYYDFGKVWNHNAGQDKTLSASSAGLGLRFQHIWGVTGALQVAFPLTKSVDAPLFGSKENAPQFTFQMGYEF